MLTSRIKSDITSTKNKILIFFYRNLQCYVSESGTTKPIQESMISKVAGDLERYEREILETPQLTSTSHTEFTDTLKESCSLLFTEEVLAFCSRHNIYHECCRYYTLFPEIFRQIQKIDIFITEDPEIQNYQKVCFVLTVKDSFENVLKYEDDFRVRLDKEIDVEKRHFFVYNYNIV